MNRHLMIIILWTFLYSINTQGQTILEKINAIKSQGDLYLYSEYTHPDGDMAVENASKWLLNQVNDGQDGPETLEGLKPYVKNIKMNRGNLIRAFVYVKKTDLPLLYGKRQNVTKVNNEENNLNAIFEQQSIPQTVPQSAPQPTQITFVPDIFIQQIQQQKTFMNVYKFLTSEKQQGRVLQFGSLKDVEDYSSFDLILFDLNSQEIVTVLSAVTQGNKRINQTNGTVDYLENYPEDMVAVIWYIK